jgi:hypothetical protein
MGSGKASTPNFGEASQPFVDAGIPALALLPIAPVGAIISSVGDLEEKVLGKAPGRFNPRSKDWRGLGGYHYITDGVPEREQQGMCAWPTPNVGVIGRYAPGIDSDANSEAARRLVEDVLNETFGRDAGIAERLRGDGPRRLYAFEASHPDDPDRRVRTRHIAFTLPSDPKDAAPHKIDVIGYGAQYLIAGRHANGKDRYEWHPDFQLTKLWEDNALERIENKDIERFIACLGDLLAQKGGKIVRQSGGSAPGLERDYTKADPIMDPRDIIEGLQAIPNTEDNFPEREDAVSILSSVRAALGREADEWEPEVRDWFTAEGWADEEYFEKIWNSLGSGQRVAQDSLDRIFRKHGNYSSAKAEFTGDTDAMMKEQREAKKERTAEKVGLLEDFASKFVIGEVNTVTNDDKYQLRPIFRAGSGVQALEWWKLKTSDPDVGMVLDLHAAADYDNGSEKGFYNFLRDCRRKLPHIFFSGETRHPGHDRGEIVKEEQPDGSFLQLLNMRYMSRTLRYARRAPKGPEEQKLARKDVDVLLEFMGRMFGEHVGYELDTLAYMLQTGKRPGHMLFLVGDQGVGKSLYSFMLQTMFDGVGKDQGGTIDGTKLTNEGARRFILSRLEGVRIVAVKELPEGTGPQTLAQITSLLKQLVDAGPDADFITIEQKNRDHRQIQNHTRVIISSNYKTAILIEQQDRRTFYVVCGITLENRPEPEYYARVAEVIENPERLAALVRHLMERDVGRYKPASPPPMTRHKAAAAVASIHDPATRHLFAALECFSASKRRVFDTRELAEVMSAMAHNEHDNTGVGDAIDYDFADRSNGAQQAIKQMARFATKLGQFKIKSGAARLPTVYGLNRYKDLWLSAIEDKNAVLDLLDADRERVPNLTNDHPWEAFSGPPRRAQD